MHPPRSPGAGRCEERKLHPRRRQLCLVRVPSPWAPALPQVPSGSDPGDGGAGPSTAPRREPQASLPEGQHPTTVFSSPMEPPPDSRSGPALGHHLQQLPTGAGRETPPKASGKGPTPWSPVTLPESQGALPPPAGPERPRPGSHGGRLTAGRGSGAGQPSLLGGRIINTPNLSLRPPAARTTRQEVGARSGSRGIGKGKGWEPGPGGAGGRLKGADGTEAGDSGDGGGAGNRETGRKRRNPEGGTAGAKRPGREAAGGSGAGGGGSAPAPEPALAQAASAEPEPGPRPLPGREDARPAAPPSLAQTWAASAARGSAWPGAPVARRPGPLSGRAGTPLPAQAPCRAAPQAHRCGRRRPGRRGRGRASYLRLSPGPPVRPASAGPGRRLGPARRGPHARGAPAEPGAERRPPAAGP